MGRTCQSTCYSATGHTTCSCRQTYHTTSAISQTGNTIDTTHTTVIGAVRGTNVCATDVGGQLSLSGGAVRRSCDDTAGV